MKEDGRVRIDSDGDVYVGSPVLPGGAREEDEEKARRHDVGRILVRVYAAFGMRLIVTFLPRLHP